MPALNLFWLPEPPRKGIARRNLCRERTAEASGKDQTGSSRRWGKGGIATSIDEPGQTGPPSTTTPITPALRTSRPSASRSSTAAVRPGWKESS
jgi:hypothetical protein